jgi:hypothetical protein
MTPYSFNTKHWEISIDQTISSLSFRFNTSKMENIHFVSVHIFEEQCINFQK